MRKSTKEEVIQDYIKCSEDYFRRTKRVTIPREVYRLHSNVSEYYVRKHFGGLAALRKAAEDKLLLRSRFTSEINEKGYQKQRYVITSIVEGAPINQDFYKALKLYCEKNNAKLLMLWMRGVLKSDIFSVKEMQEYEKYLVTSFKFNSNLEARDFLLHPAQQLPLTGLDRFGSRKTSLIISSTKQMMTSVPRPKNTTAHVLWTTGTISVPKYSKTRAGALASQDNVLGALIVEVESDKKFYIRNVEWVNDCFVDLNKAYYKDRIKNIKCEAMVWGDLHLTEECPIAVQASIDQANFLKPNTIFIHDINSFNSISHHNEGKYLTKTFIPHEFNTLRKELDYIQKKMQEILKKVNSKFMVVDSNHDAFLRRYCDEGYFLKDAHNAVLGAECFIQYTKGLNPIKEYTKLKNVTFLDKDASYKIKDIECAVHGHHGSNGSKGSPAGFRKSYNKIIVGHSHSPKILGDTWCVGTLSKLNLPYAHGASSWLHSNAVIYSNGGRQLLIWIDDKWKM